MWKCGPAGSGACPKLLCQHFVSPPHPLPPLHSPSLGQVLLGEIFTAKESFAKASAQAESYISINKDDEAIT